MPYDNKEYENKTESTEELNIDKERKETTTPDLFNKIESGIDWNLISIFSIWIFLSFTFFCIFVKY
jgi:hypothetical protein